MARGGFRIGAGRKKMPLHLRSLPRTIYLTEEEFKKVKEFVRCLKERKREEKQS